MAFAPTVPVAPKARNLPLIKLEAFTKTTLPDATMYKDVPIIVTNGGAADAPCMAVSDGIAFHVIAVGAAVA